MKQKIILIIICILNVYNVYSQTIQELKRQAETNDPAALWNVGCAYYNGTNEVSVNYTEALKWFTLAANGGYVDAFGIVSDMYYQGKGTEENHSIAFEWAKKAAIAGKIRSQKFIAWLYYNGDGTEKNLSYAFEWYKKAAIAGDIESQRFIVGLYYNGDGTEKNLEESFYWIKKIAENKQAQNYDFFNLGRFLADGIGCTRNLDEAIRWLKKAADTGNIQAYSALGDVYSYQKKYSESNKYYKMAYEKGDKYAATHLGWSYYMGEGVKQNYGEAYKYFKDAADNNEPDGYNGLSYLYMYGLGVNKDLDKAMTMIDKAIELSNNSPRYIDSKGELYAIMGDQENAKKMYNEIVKTNPTYYEKVQTTLTKYIKGETTSDVDESIPTTSDKDNDCFAVVISNENYMRESKVPFAINDGRTFTEYCSKTLGIPTSNIHFVTNATYNNIRYEINWLRNVIKAYNGKAKVIFYYAGHGIPDEQNKNAYLLPVDGYGTDVVTGYALSNLYKELSELPSQSVTVFLDACFSGTKREGDMLSSARGVAIKVKQTEPTGNLVVFSATQGDETAYPYKEKGHGMFTYYLLKKLQETKGNVTLEQLGDYIKDEVSKKSIVINGKPQTPTVIPAKSISTNWVNWTLK